MNINYMGETYKIQDNVVPLCTVLFPSHKDFVLETATRELYEKWTSIFEYIAKNMPEGYKPQASILDPEKLLNEIAALTGQNDDI